MVVLHSDKKTRIKKDVCVNIANTIGRSALETGGILGEQDGFIAAYFFDNAARSKENEYVPNVRKINETIEEWMSHNINFCGFVHSHPPFHESPSFADVEYVKEILNYNSMDKMYLSIYQEDLREKLVLYEVYMDGKVEKLCLEICE
jgi:hypothetical protein